MFFLGLHPCRRGRPCARPDRIHSKRHHTLRRYARLSEWRTPAQVRRLPPTAASHPSEPAFLHMETPHAARPSAPWHALTILCRDALSSVQDSRLPVAAHRRPVQHGLDPTSHATGDFGLGIPNGLQHSQYQRLIDIVDMHLADHRISTGFEGRGPLLAMLFIFPARAMSIEASLRALDEDSRVGSQKPLARPVSFPLFYWVCPAPHLSTKFPRLLPRFRQRYFRVAPKSDIASVRHAVATPIRTQSDHQTQHPSTGASCDAKVQTINASDRVATFWLEFGNRQGREFFVFLKHALLAHIMPHIERKIFTGQRKPQQAQLTQ
jgi:hypothetical protein